MADKNKWEELDGAVSNLLVNSVSLYSIVLLFLKMLFIIKLADFLESSLENERISDTSTGMHNSQSNSLWRKTFY